MLLATLIQSKSVEPTRTDEPRVVETKVGTLRRPDDKPTTFDGLEINWVPIGASGVTNEPFERIKAILKMCFGV